MKITDVTPMVPVSLAHRPQVPMDNPGPLVVKHGINCQKKPHLKSGMLHSKDDDGPYDVDGCLYCGRCHKAL